MRSIQLLVCGLLTCLVVTGCSSGGGMPTAVVTGKVTYQGKPVPNGTVMFVPDQGPAATGEIGPDGTYTLTTYNAGDGAVLGHHKVTITALEDMGDLLPEQQKALPGAIIPEKYLTAETSGLTADVKEGENQIDFPLTD